MPCTSAAAFAEQAKARDWNAVLSPSLFNERGLADLRSLIAAHGIDAVDEAVRDLLAKSKAGGLLHRGHVRSWTYFRPHITEQQAKEAVPCVE